MKQQPKLTPMPAPATAHRVEVRGIERWFLLQLIAVQRKASYEELQNRREIFDALLLGEDWWTLKKNPPVDEELLDTVHEVQMTRGMMERAAGLIKDAINGGEISAEQCFVIDDLKRRLDRTRDGAIEKED